MMRRSSLCRGEEWRDRREWRETWYLVLMVHALQHRSPLLHNFLSMNMKVYPWIWKFGTRKVGQDTWAAAMGLASHPPSQPWGQTQQSSPPRLSLVASVLDIDNVHSANSLAVCLPQNGKIFKSLWQWLTYWGIPLPRFPSPRYWGHHQPAICRI